MITVKIPLDEDFDYKQCRKLFKKNRSKIQGNWSFKDAIKNSFFYSFYSDDELIGCCFYYYENNRLNICAFGKRHHHLENLECLKLSLTWFTCDVYAYSIQKPAILCLLRCGFKKISDNTYKYERNKLWLVPEHKDKINLQHLIQY